MIDFRAAIDLPPAVLLLLVAIVGYTTYLYVRIARRAGLSPWWALAMQVPILNLALIWAFAFARWPAAKRD